MSPQLILLFVCLIMGVLLRRTGQFPSNTPHVLNAFIIWVSFPALVLVQIPRLLDRTVWSAEILVPVSMPWIHFVLALVLVTFLSRRLKWGRLQTGALVLTAGLGNTSFVGLPLLESILGPDSISVGVLVDQPGSFLTLSLFGILYATLNSPQEGRAVSLKKIARKIGTFPPFLALLLSGLAWTAGLPCPDVAISMLERLAGTLVPLALVAVGYQLRISWPLLRRQWSLLAVGLSYKLVLAPLFFFGLYRVFWGSSSFSTHVTLLEAAMGPMITAGVVAEEFGFDAELSSLMIGVGVPLSVGTVVLWNQFLTPWF